MSKNINAIDFLNEQLETPLTFGTLIKNIRLTEYENMTQQMFADEVLKISKTRLSDIENDRKGLTIAKAIEFAKVLGQSKRFFVTIAIQDMLRKNNLDYAISLSDGKLSAI
ncbi:helix-turn-helix domain-containing protein [Cysteiniphilum sp. JM-1]|uniref:helix-turn-helix domain-containing protein n=1 Tax=Cysteiniphilum TaxID=2056696 RepID=UPI0012463218|nr:helix-turn-helix transcriptional regulator [Cysteiniphilum sp. JM-1]